MNQKKIVVISDDDRSETENDKPTARFNNLQSLCEKNKIPIIATNNTIETDLYESGLLTGMDGFLTTKKKFNTEYRIAKDKKKTEPTL